MVHVSLGARIEDTCIIYLLSQYNLSSPSMSKLNRVIYMFAEWSNKALAFGNAANVKVPKFFATDGSALSGISM